MYKLRLPINVAIQRVYNYNAPEQPWKKLVFTTLAPLLATSPLCNN